MGNLTKLYPAVLVACSFELAYVLYPLMPDIMASHWNIYGQVDAYIPKFWGLYSMPILSVFVYFAYLLIPRMQVLTSATGKFRMHVSHFIVLTMLLLFYQYGLTLMWNIGAQFNMINMLFPSLALMFYWLGVFIEHAGKGWSISFKTSWTLESEIVWDKTHKLGGTLYKLAAALTLAGVYFQDIALVLAIVPVVAFSVFTFFYSFYLSQKLV